MACLPERCGAELDREPRLFMALPGSDTLCRPAKILPPKTHQPSLPPSSHPPPPPPLPPYPLSAPSVALERPSSSSLSSSSFSAILFAACTGGRCHRTVPPASSEKKKKKQETTAKDNPRLKTNLKLKIVYFSPPKVYKYFSITCRHFRLTLIPR